MSAPAVARRLAFPFRIAGDGRSASADLPAEQALEALVQLVLTNQGERLFLPPLGGGARRLLFQGISDATATLAHTMITQAVQEWLAGRVSLQNVNVTVNDTTIRIEILYQLAGTDETRQAIFERSAPSA